MPKRRSVRREVGIECFKWEIRSVSYTHLDVYKRQHLMYIKTRMLLSLEDEQAQSEMDELIASLKERAQKDTYLRIKTLTERCV